MAEIQEQTHETDELEIVVEAGRILMESGAEIYRIQDTMEHMAAALSLPSRLLWPSPVSSRYLRVSLPES